ncbi:phiSA1p31-related protein [Streptomyces sp. NPDC058644]|uniref:phiSA1p31-related protein n=1 Tax=unclassified Streptomyces TaxID=2593676 RepID=UPI0036621F22
MNETFKAGDEVTLTTQLRKVRVEFGPFTHQVGRHPSAYLVKYLDGNHAGTNVVVPSEVLERGPKFAVGDRVVTLPLDTPGTIAAGPFKGRRGGVFYVVEFASGTHSWMDEVSVNKAARSRAFTLAGIRWDLDGTYIDHDGDAWTFTGEYRNGAPLMTSADAGPAYSGLTLTSVIKSYGPLTKRA